MRGAILNPIKFYTPSTMPDYSTIFPNTDNITFGDSYIYGLAYSSSFIRFHIGVMYLQFETEIADDKDLYVYKQNTSGVFELADTLTSTDISPVGWVGKQIHLHTLSLTAGTYYVKFSNNYRSDYFIILTTESTCHDLIKITYSNSFNDFGCIFGAYYFTAFFVGQLIPGEPKNEYTTYESDRGSPVKLRATPRRMATLNLLGLHNTYIDLINHIFSLDDIDVNGKDFTNEDAPSWSPIEGGDVGAMSVKLTENENDYYYD